MTNLENDRNDQYKIADNLGVLLYGSDGIRKSAFAEGFREGVEDYSTGRWVEKKSISPESVGYNLGAVWKTAL